MKKKLTLWSLAFVLCLGLMVPIVFANTNSFKENPLYVTKAGDASYKVQVDVYNQSDSSMRWGHKLTNGDVFNYDDGVIYFKVENKGTPGAENQGLIVYITEDEVSISLRWHNGNNYAVTTLEGKGEYTLPRIGNNWNQVWVGVDDSRPVICETCGCDKHKHNSPEWERKYDKCPECPVEDETKYGDLAITTNLLGEHTEITHNYAQVGSKETSLVSKSELKLHNNGHTQVAINVAEATATGVKVEIADSSPNNRGVGVFYTVRIVDGALYLFFEEEAVVPASFGFRVSATSMGWANVPNHNQAMKTGFENAFRIAAPAGMGETVYLHIHFNNGVWVYNKEACVFAGQRLVTEAYTGDYTVVILDSEGTEVELVDGKLAIGEYTVQLWIGGAMVDVQEVSVAEGELSTVSLSATVTLADVTVCPLC